MNLASTFAGSPTGAWPLIHLFAKYTEVWPDWAFRGQSMEITDSGGNYYGEIEASTPPFAGLQPVELFAWLCSSGHRVAVATAHQAELRSKKLNHDRESARDARSNLELARLRGEAADDRRTVTFSA